MSKNDIPSWGEHNLHQRIKKRQATPASPGVDSVDEILKGVIAPYDKEGRHHHSWIVDELSIGEAKAALLAHDLALMPRVRRRKAIQSGQLTRKGWYLTDEDKGFNHAIKLIEQRLREGYGE